MGSFYVVKATVPAQDAAPTDLCAFHRAAQLPEQADRYANRSTTLTSQLPITDWHDQIGDPTLADSILDRLVHNLRHSELDEASMQKSKNGRLQIGEVAL